MIQPAKEIQIDARRHTPPIHLRSLQITDAWSVAACIRDRRFSYPLLTGGAGARLGRIGSFGRALRYVGVCIVANRLGSWLFGRRLHWIMAIEAADRRFAGVVMIDEVLRHRATESRPGTRFLKRPELRLPLRRGDGELGFFLHPNYQGMGYGTAACLNLIHMLHNRREADGSPTLKRVWAETGRANFPARRLLERLGLSIENDVNITGLERFERNGQRVELVHYGHPALAVDDIFSVISRNYAACIESPS